MKAYECEIGDIITYNAERCVVMAKSDMEVSVFNTKTRDNMDIPSLTYVVMVERPRRLYPKGHEFRVYKISKENAKQRLIFARGLTYPEAESIIATISENDKFYYIISNGKVGREQK